ncbi:MAG: pre-mRNA cleavage complex 2 protein Pcf11 [Bacillariaceae sp.]|jgi:pre-mRNA cleavage complex 2 protein Pcf11
MQIILDEMQQEESEMEKVSLERLAVINVNLLIQIKEMAESSLKANSSGGAANALSSSSSKPTDGGIGDELSFFIETRTPETLQCSSNWEKISISQNMKDARDVIASLHHLVRESSNIENRYTQTEAIGMTGALATASVTASILTSTLQLIKDASDNKNKKSKMSKTGNGGLNGMSRSLVPNFYAIDKSLFTNDGIKELNEAIIELLYGVGLPFISSGDGRRFATQLELSNHLDALFKKGQLEKSMATTQERGWYDNDLIWSGGDKTQNDATSTELDDGDASGLNAGDDDTNPDEITMPADESRDRCVICGINFKMFFDNDDGIYKYSNCREIEVLNDEAAAKESDQMLVHVTCWRNLGSPELMTADQTLQ